MTSSQPFTRVTLTPLERGRRGKLEPFEFELVPEKRRVRHSEYVPPRFQDGYWNG